MPEKFLIFLVSMQSLQAHLLQDDFDQLNCQP